MPAPSPPANTAKGTIYGYVQTTDGSTLAGYVFTAYLVGPDNYDGDFILDDAGSETLTVIPKTLTATSAVTTGLWSMDPWGNDRILPAGSYWRVTEPESHFSRAIELAAGAVVNAPLVADGSIPTGGTYTPPVTFVTIATGDPNADRIVFWDDSAGTYAYLTAGTGLTITGTTITAAGASGLTVGTTTITSGTSGRVLYDNAGVVGEMTTTGSGTVLALATSPSFTTPALGTPSAGVLTNCTGLPVSTGLTGQTTIGQAMLVSTNPGAITFGRANADNTFDWLSAANFRTAIGATTGTVTSVGWTGGIVSVATGTTTPAFTVAGTSGGIPYFSSASTWASSGALAANALVIGGGAGASPATTTTGTGVIAALAAGASVGGSSNADAGKVVVFGSSGGLTASNVFQIAGDGVSVDGAMTIFNFDGSAGVGIRILGGLVGYKTLVLSASGTAITTGNLTDITGAVGGAFGTGAYATAFNPAIPGAIGGTTPAAGTFTTLTAGSTTSLLLGTAGSAVGNIGFRNATSGTITLAPPTGALGTVAVTLPNAASTLPIFGQQVTFTGPTAARSYALPDAAATLARTDAAQTFTGNQTVTGHLLTTAANTYDIGSSGNPFSNAWFANDVNMGGTSRLNFTGQSRIVSNGAGIIQLWNWGGDNFNRLQFGGTDATYPGLIRNGTSLQIGRADGTLGAGIGGKIFQDFADGASVSVDGTEDTLATHTLAASTWATNGDVVSGFFQLAIIGHAISTDRIRLYCAGTAIFDTTALNFPLTSAMTITFEVVRVSSTVLRASCTCSTSSATVVAYSQYVEITSLTLSNTQIVALKSISTGTNSAAADVTAKLGKILWHPAA